MQPFANPPAFARPKVGYSGRAKVGARAAVAAALAFRAEKGPLFSTSGGWSSRIPRRDSGSSDAGTEVEKPCGGP